jgi:predicted nucleic acid-binding protein
MRRYLLDAGPLAALLHNRPAAVALMKPWLQAHEAATSILVYGEVVEYLKPLTNFALQYQGLQNLIGEVRPFFLTYPIVERYGDLRFQLRKPHGAGLIGDVDTLIAATALERRLQVVTADRDFLRVPCLPVLLLDRLTYSILVDRRSTR